MRLEADRFRCAGLAVQAGFLTALPGDAYGNALMATINGSYKAECIRSSIFHDGLYKMISGVVYATGDWVD